ncbi:MAG: hypothetical protein NE330_14125 [Lentisphaeraceae bacterium]|nr:hypothetical protein [Lentisphaeraceae bacterium]
MYAQEEEPPVEEAQAPPAAKAIGGGGAPAFGGGGGAPAFGGGGGAPVAPPAPIAPPPAPAGNIGGGNTGGGVKNFGGSRGSQNKVIKSTTDGAGKIQSGNDPDDSGDFFDSFSISTNVSYSSFTDDVVGSSGHFDSRSISLSSSIGSDFSLGLEYSEDRYNYGRKATLRKVMLRSTTLYGHYTINDNFGIGGYGYYQSVDIEDQNPNSYTYGTGLLFTSFHQAYGLNIQTATSASWIDYDFSAEAVFYSQLSINKDFTDWFNFGANIAFSDSFAEQKDFGLDRTYWNGGVEAKFFLNDFFISVGYSKTFKLSGYTDNTLNVGLTYTF